MAIRPIKPTARPLLDKVLEAALAEKRVRDRAAEDIRNRVRDFRNATNDAALQALQGGVTKEQMRVALDVSRTAIDTRITEAKDRLTEGRPAATGDDAPVSIATLDVRTDDTGTTVTLANYTHPDLGADVSGSFLFNADGDLVSTDRPLIIDADPMFGLKLWALTEVQDALA